MGCPHLPGAAGGRRRARRELTRRNRRTDGIAEALGGTTTTPPTGACSATYGVTSQWNSGFTGQVTIACTGTALSSWRASWTYGAGQQLTQAWNATCTQSGRP
ncbi:cellulose binding domain-containing protein [Streptomyces sp. L7]